MKLTGISGEYGTGEARARLRRFGTDLYQVRSRSCSITSLENMSEGQTALDSDDIIPAYRTVRLMGKRQRLLSSPREFSSDEESHQPLSTLACERCHRREKVSRGKERTLNTEISDAGERRRAMGLDVGDACTADTLSAVGKDVDVILQVATNFMHLRGPPSRKPLLLSDSRWKR